MPQFIVQKVQKALDKPLHDARILAIGVTYKKDVNDLRESMALEVLKELKKTGAQVEFHDPLVDTITVRSFHHEKYESK